jgi:hypothetical protein
MSQRLSELERFFQILELAHSYPSGANVRQICRILDQILLILPIEEQLVIGAKAVELIADLICTRANRSIEDWEAFYSPLTDPLVSLEQSVDLFVQSQSLDLDHLFEAIEPNLYPENRKPREGSIVGELDKQSLLEALDVQMETGLSEAEAFNQALSVAHSEDISTWAEQIESYLLKHSSTSIDDLSRSLGLSKIEVWLSLLLGGFVLKPVTLHEFYGNDIQVLSSKN